ncbi:SIR2 family NAD-dependent protein deacylase [Methanospirillum sp.]
METGLICNENSNIDSLENLIDQIRNNNVILWAGAGLSKPLGYPLGSELSLILYNDLINGGYQVNISQYPPLQVIAQIFEDIYGRSVLINRISALFNNKNTESDIHNRISKIPQIKHIITTNYDNLFEYAYRDQSHQIIRADENYQLSANNGRKTTIYKIHGDFFKPERIILTTEDYIKFDKESVLWNNVRVLVAQNAILFLGYSLGDDNVIKMIWDIQDRLEGGIRDMFIVTRNPNLYTSNYHFFKYPIQIISCSYETAISKIEESLICNSYLDKKEGRLSDAEFTSLISGKNIQFDQILKHNGLNQISFFPKSPNENLKCSISFKKPQHSSQLKSLIEYFNGKHFEKVVLNLGRGPGNFSADIEGIKLVDERESYTESYLSINPLPNFEYLANFKLSDNSIELTNISVEHYLHYGSGFFKVIYSHPSFKMVIQQDLENISLLINITLNLVVHNVMDGYFGFNLLDKWFNSQDLIIMTSKFGTYTLPSYHLISHNLNETKKRIHFFSSLYSDIKEIQDYCNIFLTLSLIKLLSNTLSKLEMQFVLLDKRTFH